MTPGSCESSDYVRQQQQRWQRAKGLLNTLYEHIAIYTHVGYKHPNNKNIETTPLEASKQHVYYDV